MIKYIIYTLIGLPLFVIAISFATIFKQGVSLTDAPGLKARLSDFFRYNTVATSEDHAYPELRTQHYDIPSSQLKQLIVDNINNLGWQLEADNGNKLHIIVSSALINFKDDMHIELISEDNKTKLNIKSSSRVGRADFAANLGHVVKLKKQLEQSLSAK